MRTFDRFFLGLSASNQQRFADLAGYKVGYIRKHLVAPQWRRKRPRASGLERLTAACKIFRHLSKMPPSAKDLVNYFYGNGGK